MRKSLLVFLAACGGNNDPAALDAPASTTHDGSPALVDAQGGTGEPAELAGMTLYHNQIRQMVDTPTPLPALEWDADLAAYAAAWAAKCQDTEAPTGLIDHDPDRSNVAGFTYIGENIFASSGTATAMGAVTSWAAEKADYDYATNTCASGAICGHYTQVVWRATLKLGCALHNCAGLTYPSSIVCDYGPGGNFNGEKPY